jgi:hypothetical protein
VPLTPLWLGILGPPAAWAAQLLVAYSPVELLCSPGSSGDLWGIGLNAFGIACTIAAVLGTIFSGVVAHRTRRRLDEAESSPAVDRSAFMARFGVYSAAYFLVVILLTAIGPLVLEGCR